MILRFQFRLFSGPLAVSPITVQAPVPEPPAFEASTCSEHNRAPGAFLTTNRSAKAVDFLKLLPQLALQCPSDILLLSRRHCFSFATRWIFSGCISLEMTLNIDVNQRKALFRFFGIHSSSCMTLQAPRFDLTRFRLHTAPYVSTTVTSGAAIHKKEDL